MLVKASTIIGLPVYTIHDGKKIDVIKDLLYHPKQNRIAGLLVDTGGFFSEAKVIVFEDIASIGDDAILIGSVDVLRKASTVQQDIESIAKSETYLTGVEILTETGVSLGTVSDIYFNTESGIVEEFEATEDARNPHSSRQRVKISDIITLGKDATIVKVPANNYHEYAVRKSESRGIMRAIQNMRQAVKEHLETMTHPATEEEKPELDNTFHEDIKASEEKSIETHPDSSIDTNHHVTETRDARYQEIVGLYLTKNILTLDDTMLAKEGDIVTHKLLDEAEAAGVLKDIMNNVGHHLQLTS